MPRKEKVFEERKWDGKGGDRRSILVEVNYFFKKRNLKKTFNHYIGFCCFQRESDVVHQILVESSIYFFMGMLWIYTLDNLHFQSNWCGMAIKIYLLLIKLSQWSGNLYKTIRGACMALLRGHVPISIWFFNKERLISMMENKSTNIQTVFPPLDYVR